MNDDSNGLEEAYHYEVDDSMVRDSGVIDRVEQASDRVVPMTSPPEIPDSPVVGLLA